MDFFLLKGTFLSTRTANVSINTIPDKIRLGLSRANYKIGTPAILFAERAF